ncbi:putative pentatricopeptide repeat-containing protein At5g37570 [Phalaenopsis equestris]|uniref:putative pentatricopeptide repeat-containing protein At5g37570 n=1 Tax=Phalaenopsis equestris TaxID=78828 RepID=UPI0009E2B5A6|nr:putative pentatricopeptide repeat-containing protein At5g37570 [Phalaenopsis equestris]
MIFSLRCCYRCLSSSSSAAALPTTASFPSSPSVASLLLSCRSLRSLQQIHPHFIRKGLEQHQVLVCRFIVLCTSHFALRYASEVFFRVSSPNVILWNALLNASSNLSSLSHTVSLFNLMRRSQHPDGFSFPCLLKACSFHAAFFLGASLHSAVLHLGLEDDLFIRTSLVDFYGKCRQIDASRKLFDTIRNEVTWTAMIAGYLISGNLLAARLLFDEMPERNLVTWNVMIDGYVKAGDLMNARKVFDHMPKRNEISFTSMIDGYTKAGDMASARFLFEQLDNKDVFLWSAMISGYAQNCQPIEAFKLFLEMHNRKIKPDQVIMVGLMSACAQLGRTSIAKWVDQYVQQIPLDASKPHVLAALIDMNAKCGNMKRAVFLFDSMQVRDLVSYCSLMQGYSIHGFGAESAKLFDQMLREGIIPDNVAFTVIFTACAQAGLIEEGSKYFKLMKDVYNITPSNDHYACMVDLLGRAGLLKEAYDFVKSMPVEPHAGVWGALLLACRMHCNTELAEIALSSLSEVEPRNAGNFVSMSNIYAADDRWADVSKVRNVMKLRGLRKIPGCTWVYS